MICLLMYDVRCKMYDVVLEMLSADNECLRRFSINEKTLPFWKGHYQNGNDKNLC